MGQSPRLPHAVDGEAARRRGPIGSTPSCEPGAGKPHSVDVSVCDTAVNTVAEEKVRVLSIPESILVIFCVQTPL